MKLIYLHQYFKTPLENGGTRSYDLARSFVKAGYTVYMVSTTNDEKIQEKGKKWVIKHIDGIQVHYLYLPYDNSMSYLKRSVAFVKFLLYATFKLLKLKGDLLLATSTPLTIGVPSLIKKWFHKTPLVFEVRDVWPEAVIAIGAISNKYMQKMLYRLEKLVYTYADAIVPLSSDMQKSIISRYPQFESKTNIVIENISEVQRFSKLVPVDFSRSSWIGKEVRFAVLYAGTFGKVNNIDYVLELAKKTIEIDPTIAYILLGAGSEKIRIMDAAKAAGLYNVNVFFPDAVKKDQLNDVYDVADIGSSFVAPIKDLWANSANKFFDTLASGKPILINHEGWQAEVIRREDIGFVLTPALTDEEIHSFVKYTQDYELIKLQGGKAREVAMRNYSLEVASSKYLTIFKSLHV